MEAIERHAGESCDYQIMRGSYREMRHLYSCMNPIEIIVPRLREFDEDLSLEWVAGYDLINKRETLALLNCVVCPYEAKGGACSIFLASTNGLASGNTLTEAVCHALCEIIERDAQAISMGRTHIRPAVHGLLSSDMRQDGYWLEKRRISLDGLPWRASRLVNTIQRAGLKVFLRDLTMTAAIATIECMIVEAGFDGFASAYGGCGTHPDARVAILRAITEAAQSRLTCIQGGREDLPHIMSQKSYCESAQVDEVFGAGTLISFSDIPSYEHEYIDDDVRLLLERLPAYGLEQLVAFDLTRAEVGIPVARLVAPRAETWAVFHLHTGRGVFGPRLAQELL
jgi:ribosomal protein S12 methylthiotransferase accessory factor YcaO